MEEPIVEQPIEQIVPPRPSADSTFSAMRHRNFQLYFGGQLVSNIGCAGYLTHPPVFWGF